MLWNIEKIDLVVKHQIICFDKTHKLAHIFDLYYEECIYLFLEKYVVAL